MRLASLLLPLFATTAAALNVELWGVNYDLRTGPDWAPDSERCKTPDQIERDLRALAGITSRVRTYSLSDCPIAPVLTTAKTLGLTVWLGMWTASDPAVFERELSTLQMLVNPGSSERGLFFPPTAASVDVGDDTSPVVEGINVGSEAVYRGDVTAAVAVECLTRVRQVLQEAAGAISTETSNSTSVSNLNAGIVPPLAVTDIVDILLQYPELVAAGDVVTVNVFPFWERVEVGKAAKRIDDRLRPLRQLADSLGKKELIVTETGWASAGTASKASKASPANMAKYLAGFVSLASRRHWQYYYFAGFDTPYKAVQLQDPTTVETSFGIFDVNGTMKPAIANLVVDLSQKDDGEESKSMDSSNSNTGSHSEESEGSDANKKSSSSDESSTETNGASKTDSESPAASSQSGASSQNQFSIAATIAVATTSAILTVM